MNDERMQKIGSHVDDTVARFKEELKRMAIEHDHPYIEVYLNLCLCSIYKAISSNAMMSGDEMVKFQMNL